MRETADDLERLQRLLDDSIERASGFLRSSFQMPERSLDARSLAARLDGSLTVALATVTARGEPRVAPINAFFLRASFYVPTVAESARARHLASRPAASLTYFERTSLAVIAHGNVEIVPAEHPAFDELDEAQVALGHQSPREWRGHAVYLHLEPSRLYTYTELAPAGGG
ncbi:MAG TPA: pyridoxamine 5'-phosphate oxidase family protein [Solirubrobacteraceae bacterium]|nr:pyridoxamine 5'-phosphate oxidase family protein [Solirubrobacteraceae bacterium]